MADPMGFSGGRREAALPPPLSGGVLVWKMGFLGFLVTLQPLAATQLPAGDSTWGLGTRPGAGQGRGSRSCDNLWAVCGVLG